MKMKVEKKGKKSFIYISKDNVKTVNLFLISIGFIYLLLILEMAYYYIN